MDAFSRLSVTGNAIANAPILNKLYDAFKENCHIEHVQTVERCDFHQLLINDTAKIELTDDLIVDIKQKFCKDNIRSVNLFFLDELYYLVIDPCGLIGLIPERHTFSAINHYVFNGQLGEDGFSYILPLAEFDPTSVNMDELLAFLTIFSTEERNLFESTNFKAPEQLPSRGSVQLWYNVKKSIDITSMIIENIVVPFFRVKVYVSAVGSDLNTYGETMFTEFEREQTINGDITQHLFVPRESRKHVTLFCVQFYRVSDARLFITKFNKMLFQQGQFERKFEFAVIGKSNLVIKMLVNPRLRQRLIDDAIVAIGNSGYIHKEKRFLPHMTIGQCCDNDVNNACFVNKLPAFDFNMQPKLENVFCDFVYQR